MPWRTAAFIIVCGEQKAADKEASKALFKKAFLKPLKDLAVAQKTGLGARSLLF